MKNYFAIQWHITDCCDQRCKHCYIYSEGHPQPVSMAYGDMLRVIDQINDLCDRLDRTPYIYLTGGDPILHPDFWRLLEQFHARGLRFCIMGNPFHLTAEVCERMRALGCVKYQVSLDGLEATHDAFRKPGSFQATLEAIGRIKASGMWAAVMTTVSKVNHAEIPTLIDLVDALGVDVYAVGRYCPTSVAKAYDPDVHMSPQEYRDFLDSCYQRYVAHGDSRTTYQLKDHLWTLYLYEKGLFKPNAALPENAVVDGCNCGRNHVTILPTGMVYACRRMESPIGSVLERPLYELWTSPKYDGYRRYDRFTKCSRCVLGAYCRGCPAVTKGYTGDMYDADPQCWMEVEA